ncbi:MAG: hypothetical protein WCE45_10535 [Sedimentisphaerales bacterium]
MLNRPSGTFLRLFDPPFLPKVLWNALIAMTLVIPGVRKMKGQNDNSKSALHDYITVAVAEDIDLANEYRDVLAKNDIPAVTAAAQRSRSAMTSAIAVMVPENFLEQAQQIIEYHQEFDHFIDDAFNDPDSWQDDPDMEYFDEKEDLDEEENF